MQYDTLVIATGTTGPFPTKVENLSETETVYKYDDLSTQVIQMLLYKTYGHGQCLVKLTYPVFEFHFEITSEIQVNYTIESQIWPSHYPGEQISLSQRRNRKVIKRKEATQLTKTSM